MMDDRRYPTECWLSPAAHLGPSPIHGGGLFAATRINAGDLVMRLGGKVIDDATLAALADGAEPYDSLTVAPGAHLLIDSTHPVRYGNHSCDPNIWHANADATAVIARRDIRPGEELTIDYATHTGVQTWFMACRCTSPRCRGTVTGSDWRLPHLQRAYGDHWSPALLDRISGTAR